MELLPGGTVANGSLGVVIIISDTLIVKRGSSIRMAEAEVVRYIERHTSVPVPRIRLAFRRKNDTYLVMDCIPGHNLQEAWDELDNDQR